MSTDISGFGLEIVLVADKTYPAGITLSQFADDADPFDIPAIDLADKGMGLNGDMVVWAKATPIEIAIALVPSADDDANMLILAENNRVGKGKRNLRDKVSLTAIYKDGRRLILQEGFISNAPAGLSVASAGRYKSNTYKIVFENKG